MVASLLSVALDAWCGAETSICRPGLDVRPRGRATERGRAPGLPMMPDERTRVFHLIRGGYDLDSEAVIATLSPLFPEHARS